MAYCLPWIVTFGGFYIYLMYLLLVKTTFGGASWTDGGQCFVCGSGDLEFEMRRSTFYYNLVVSLFTLLAVTAPFVEWSKKQYFPMRQQKSLPVCWYHQNWTQIVFAVIPALISFIALALYGFLTIQISRRYEALHAAHGRPASTAPQTMSQTHHWNESPSLSSSTDDSLGRISFDSISDATTRHTSTDSMKFLRKGVIRVFILILIIEVLQARSFASRFTGVSRVIF